MDGLKPEIAYDVREDNFMNFTDTAKLALLVEEASRGCCSRQNPSNSARATTRMDIVNVEAGRPLNRRALSNEEMYLAENSQCFKCKMKSCCPCKRSCKARRSKRPQANFNKIDREGSVVHDVEIQTETKSEN